MFADLISIIFYSSGIIILLLIALLSLESRRGSRLVFTDMRTWLDGAISRLGNLIANRLQYIGSGVLRQLTHFCVHHVLSWVLKGIRALESRIKHLLRYNRRSAVAASGHVDEHLAQVRAHKEEIELTDAQKRAKRRKMLV